MKRLFALASLMLAAMTTCASAWDKRAELDYVIPGGASSGSAVEVLGLVNAVRGLSLFTPSIVGPLKVHVFAKATTPVLGVDQPLMTGIVASTFPPTRILNTNGISTSTTSPTGKLWVIASSYTGGPLGSTALIQIGVDGQ